MQKTAQTERSKTKNVLVLGKRTEKVRELERLLAEHFNKVSLISDLPNSVKLPLNDYFNTIIVTDPVGAKLNNRLFSNLRILFPSARLLCLVDKITPETEMAMRSAGLIFLGSYDHFSNNYQDILKSAVKPKRVERGQPSTSGVEKKD